MNKEKKEETYKLIDAVLKACEKEVIYEGYVDDPRNTDNAWVETTAYNFHDETGENVAKFNLKAGDDAKKVKWMTVNDKLELLASHKDFMKEVAKLHDAHWETTADKAS